jgi:hypothetical protein
MKAKSILFTTLFLVGISGPARADSSFQQSCSNIAFAYDGSSPTLRATCLRANGTPNSTSLVIQGISNQNGVLTQGGGNSTFQQSCGNIQITVTPTKTTLSALCRTASGSPNVTSIELKGISNKDGMLSR